MRKILILFIAVLIYADVSEIVIKISEIEKYKPKFKTVDFKLCRKNIIISPIKTNNVKFKLLAIMNKKALINNKWVSKGDFIRDWEVVKIYNKKVVLKKENKILILKFNNILRISK
jgi:hypothetical protein